MIRLALQLAGAAAAMQGARRFGALRGFRAKMERLGWGEIALLLFCALTFGVILGMSFATFFRRHFLSLTAGFVSALGAFAARLGFFSLPSRASRP